MKCSRCDCESVIKQGNQLLCEKHYRFGQMRASAKRNGKTVPSHEELERIASDGMCCPDCGCTMNWRMADGKATVASLQHYRDGSFGIVCLSCNSRHGSMQWDSYCDMSPDYKHCPSCKKEKPKSEFFSDKGRSGVLRRKSYCKECSHREITAWRKENRDAYNEYQRRYREKRKANGNPVRRRG